MIELPGYSIFRELYKGELSSVYHGQRNNDNKQVAIKVLLTPYPTPEQLDRIRYEYKIETSLKGDGTVNVYSLENHENSLAIIYEYYDAITLKQFLQKRPITVNQFLVIALKIVTCLDKIHRNKIIHKDLKPENILWNENKEELKIIDFGSATLLERETPETKNPRNIMGTLAYVSPEITGRMNRSVDYRTDFYSLGVIFYEMLTNRLPFRSKDPMELVHAHIAKLAKAPHELDAKIPEGISNIVMKLLAKQVEERYQSSLGIKEDLLNCIDQLNMTGKIEPFTLGTHDVSDHFRIPEKLYGREEENKKLIEIFNRARKNHPELVLITGPAGIGKSRLVNELNKTIVENKGYFISGKFDQFQRNIPYSAIIQAFQSLIEQISSNDKLRLKTFKKQLLEALGSNGSVLIDVFPTLVNIIGKQQPVPNFGYDETKNRFNHSIQKMIEVIATDETPIILFLDDLQWIDSASLSLLKSILINSERARLLIIGSYRDSEVDASHPFSLMLDELKKNQIFPKQFTVRPLELEDVAHLIADTLHRDVDLIKTFAMISYEKTHGNPFFLTQFLHRLHNDKLIQFDYTKGYWSWDIEKIKIQPITDNVAELIAYTIKQLSEESQQLLMYAACLGNKFDLKKLSLIIKKPSQYVAKLLWDSINIGIIVPIGDNYKFINDENEINPTYQFLHDRIQQSAYSLIPQDKINQIHYEIGQLLYTHYGNQKENIFEITDHMNMALALFVTEDKKHELAKLNFLAGKKAKLSAAYKVAYHYFKTGISLINNNFWNKDYDLSYQLYMEAVSTAYSQGDFKEMESLSKIALSKTRSVLDKIPIYETNAQKYLLFDSLSSGIEISKNMLSELGVSLPKHPNMMHVFWNLLTTKLALFNRSTDDILNMPRMTDPYKSAAIRILGELAMIAYMASPALSILCILKAVKLSVKYGNAPNSAMSYAQFGFLMCAMNQYDKGYDFGQVALQLMDKYKNYHSESAILCQLNLLVNHWKRPLSSFIDSSIKAYTSGMEYGNLESASASIVAYITLLFYSGADLNKIQASLKKFKKVTQNIFHAEIFKRTLQNLIYLDKQNFDEDIDINKLNYSGDKTGLLILFSHKMMLYYLFDRCDKAYENALIKDDYYKYMPSGVGIPVIRFYDSLTRLAQYMRASNKEKRRIYKKVVYNQKLFKKWSHYCPQNYLHKYYLVEAELSRIQHNTYKAAEFYDLAIEYAQKNNFIQEAALASELAGKFYLERNRIKFASTHFTAARYLYSKWGAKAKVKHLEDHYTEFFKVSSAANLTLSPMENLSPSPRSTSGDFDLDLHSAVKFSQALTNDVVLTNLLKKLMKIIIENAGAKHGYLILKHKGEWAIEASGSIEKTEISVLHHRSLERLPQSVINYVIHTHKPVLLGRAIDSEQFGKDPKIVALKTKSILCLPLLNQGKLTGLLYLENNLLDDAFTKERYNLLKMFSTQIAISIDNANLYTRLTELIEAYEHFVPKSLLQFLAKKSITEVHLGNHVQQNMTIMFCDIRNFTNLAEKLPTKDIFLFINKFLSLMEPIILNHKGFIDKYIGDAVLAIFPTANDSLSCSTKMFEALNKHNKVNPINIHIGIGINSGTSLLGIVGGLSRMEGTVISDAVNIASRVQDLTKIYKTPLLITEETYKQLDYGAQFNARKIDTVLIKGRDKPVTLYEVFDIDNPEVAELKKETQNEFEYAVNCYENGKVAESLASFQRILKLNPKDTVAAIYVERCKTEAGGGIQCPT